MSVQGKIRGRSFKGFYLRLTTGRCPGFLFPVLLGLFLIALAGCSVRRESRSKVINFISLGEVNQIKVTSGLIKKYESIHPGVKVRVSYPPGAGGVRQKILFALASDVPLDIVYLNDTAFPEFVARRAFTPLDKFISKDKTFNLNKFLPAAIKAATFKGKVYAIPPMFGTGVIYYNKTLFRKAGIPYPRDGWSWEEFRDTAKKLTLRDKDGRVKQFGLVGVNLWFWLPMVFQNGGRILNAKGVCVFNSQAVVQTLQFVKDLYLKDKVLLSKSTPGVGTVGMGTGAAFAMGKAAMLYGGFGIFETFPNLDWDIVSLPEKKGGKKYFHGGFWGYAIAAKSRNKELAWNFLKFLTSKETQKETLEGIKEGKWMLDAIPSRTSLDDYFLSLFPHKHLESFLYSRRHPEFKLAHPWGRSIINEVAAQYAISDNLDGVAKGDLKTLLDNFTKEVNRRLGK